MKVFIITVLTCLLYGQAQASRGWMFNNATVEEVGLYSRVISGARHVILHVKLSDIPTDTGCAPTDTHGVVFYSEKDTNFGANVQMMYSALLSAQAQRLPVDLMIESDICNITEAWDYKTNPKGLGLNMVGVIVDADGD